MNDTTNKTAITTTIKVSARKVTIILEALRLAGDFLEAYEVKSLQHEIPATDAALALADAGEWMRYGTDAKTAAEELDDTGFGHVKKADWIAVCGDIVRCAARKAAEAESPFNCDDCLDIRKTWDTDPPCPSCRSSEEAEKDASCSAEASAAVSKLLSLSASGRTLSASDILGLGTVLRANGFDICLKS